MQQNDKSVVTVRGSVDFIDEDKSSVISEFEGYVQQERVQFSLFSPFDLTAQHSTVAPFIVKKLARRMSKNLLLYSTGSSRGGADLGRLQATVAQYIMPCSFMLLQMGRL